MTADDETPTLSALYAPMLEEGRRRLDAQERRVDDMRQRAQATLGAAGVVVGLFGLRAATAPFHGERLVLASFAIALFVVCALGSVAMQWVFKLDAGDELTPWVSAERSADYDPRDFVALMARTLDSARLRNEEPYKRLVRLSQIVQLAFGAEVILWSLTFII